MKLSGPGFRFVGRILITVSNSFFFRFSGFFFNDSVIVTCVFLEI